MKTIRLFWELSILWYIHDGQLGILMLRIFLPSVFFDHRVYFLTMTTWAKFSDVLITFIQPLHSKNKLLISIRCGESVHIIYSVNQCWEQIKDVPKSIHPSLCYNYTFCIRYCQCVLLCSGPSELYVSLQVDKDKYLTSSVPKQLSPYWNEVFVM